MIKISETNFQTEVIESSIPVLVDFWAEWCPPCKVLVPILDELANEYGARIKICKANVEDNSKFTSQFGIGAVPTILIFKGGQMVKKDVGLKTKKEIQEDIEGVINGVSTLPRM